MRGKESTLDLSLLESEKPNHSTTPTCRTKKGQLCSLSTGKLSMEHLIATGQTKCDSLVLPRSASDYLYSQHEVTIRMGRGLYPVQWDFEPRANSLPRFDRNRWSVPIRTWWRIDRHLMSHGDAKCGYLRERGTTFFSGRSSSPFGGSGSLQTIRIDGLFDMAWARCKVGGIDIQQGEEKACGIEDIHWACTMCVSYRLAGDESFPRGSADSLGFWSDCIFEVSIGDHAGGHFCRRDLTSGRRGRILTGIEREIV